MEHSTLQRNSEKIRASFVANVSHELKTPLSTIIGFIETIRTTAKNDENSKEEFLNIINDEANRMDRLIDDLLTVSKIEFDILDNKERSSSVTADNFEFRNITKVNIVSSNENKCTVLFDSKHSIEDKILNEQFNF